MKKHHSYVYSNCILLFISYIGIIFFISIHAIKAQESLPTTEQAFSAMDLKSDVKIRSDSGIEWDRKNNLYRATGNAQVVYDNNTINADVLIAHYRENNQGKTEIWLVEAEGNIIITSDQGRVEGNHAQFDVASQTLTITGDVHISNDQGQVFGDKGVYNHKTQLAKITGHVRIAQKNNFILGHRAEVDFKNGINRIESGPRQQVRGLVIPKDLRRPPSISE